MSYELEVAQEIGKRDREVELLREQVEKLTKERDEYRLKYQLKADKADTYGSESSRYEDTIEFATEYALNTANYLHQHFFSDVTQWRPLDDLIGLQTQISNLVTGIGEQLAALAGQSEKQRTALNKFIWRRDRNNDCWCSDCNCIIDYRKHKPTCILSLPDLASPILNRIRAEGMRMAAEICEKWGGTFAPHVTVNACNATHKLDEAIRARADELEKTND